MSFKYQEKIDKYVDNLFYNINAKSNSASIQPLNNEGSHLKINKYVQEQQSQEYFDKKKLQLPQTQQCYKQMSKQDIQFFQLLYPYQQPKQIMKKLLKLYKQESKNKNSFQQFSARICKSQENETNKQTNNNQTSNKYSRQKGTLQNILQSSQFGSSKQASNKQVKCQDNTDYQKQVKINSQQCMQYAQLIQTCYVSLGKKLIQTHVSQPEVQISNVNFYTRQYVMPHIMQILRNKKVKDQIKQTNLIQSKQTLQCLRQKPTFTSLNYQKMFYLPINDKGQFFDRQTQIQEQLFDYISHNDYNRVLKDINRTIQKTLAKQRQYNIIKKSSLLTNWNIFIFMLLLLNIFMYLVRSYLFLNQNYQISCFLVTALTFVIILGHAFNNYRLQVNRKSMIQSISQQIKKYLNFYNCKSRNVKWILGKHFFWVEIHIKSRYQKVS